MIFVVINSKYILNVLIKDVIMFNKIKDHFNIVMNVLLNIWKQNSNLHVNVEQFLHHNKYKIYHKIIMKNNLKVKYKRHYINNLYQ